MSWDLNSLLLLSIPFITSVLAYFLDWTWVIAVTMILLAALKRRRIYIILKTLPRDVRFIYRMSLLVTRTKKYEKSNATVVSAFRQQVQRSPDKVAYVFGDTQFTLRDVEEYSNKVAWVFYEANYKKGDVVSLMMSNCPEFVCIWLGLAKIGVVTALINTNLRGASLQHCASAALCKAIIFSDDMKEAVFEALSDVQLYQWSGEVTRDKVINFKQLIKEAKSEPNPLVELNYADKLLYIYTSGTTGLPKPAILPHSRYILATMATMSLLDVQKDDIIYNPLPLYHTAGGALGAGPALLESITTVLRKKFSASSYIEDCIKYKCTIGQYIGEMCRYILASPPKPTDTQHNLKLMLGNGLRPAIWAAFVRRFKIPKITEVYGATEGNVNIANLDNTIGAVGSLPQCLPQFLFPVAIIKIDPITEEPVRGPDGLCVRCESGEPGMFVGLIKSNDPSRQFHGYVNKSDSKKKVIQDVFSRGDSAFVSGDIMVMDEFGYIFFKDRTGDTFRWKGENVATSEVEAVVSAVAGLRDCTVYGVPIGDLEGKAGMAALVDPKKELDFPALAYALDISLPSYARPLFLRVVENVELTGTYKLKKIEFRDQGFNPDIVPDRMYFRQGSTFVPLTKTLYNAIVAGEVKL